MSIRCRHFESQLTLLTHSYALKGCINCRQAEQLDANPLCQACNNTLSQYAPMLVQVPSDNKIFWDSKPCRTHTDLRTFLIVRYSDRPIHRTMVVPHGMSNGSCSVQGYQKSAELGGVQFLSVCCLPNNRRGPRNRTDDSRD